MSQAVLKALQDKFGTAVLESGDMCGDDTVVLDRSALLDAARYLRDDPAMAFNMPIDVTAVDYLEYPGHDGPRFMVVYHLYSLTQKHRIRLKVPVGDDDPKVDSLFSVWRGVDWFERETWDMYGIHFEGHPNLKRLLMYEEFEGHPLRKDYPLRGYQPLVPIARLDGAEEDPKLKNIDLNPPVPDSARGSK
jgi:NADH-quinone oxidoreductase subunit C